MKRFILAMVLGGASIGVNAATIIYDESVSGDAPVPWVGGLELMLSHGENLIRGSTSWPVNEVLDQDSYLLTLPQGYAIAGMSMEVEPIGVDQFAVQWHVYDGSGPWADPQSTELGVLRSESDNPPPFWLTEPIWPLMAPEFFLGLNGAARAGDALVGSTYAWTITTTAVPIPAAVWLFGSALGLLGWMRRKAT